MKKLLNKKGQFSIIAALLVAIVLVTAIITTYSIIRNNPLEDRPQILGSADEMNLAINHILEFVIGYYGSILQVTGNTTYAKSLAADYLRSGLENIAYVHPNWSPSFQLNDFEVSASWFNRTSYSRGVINVTYSLLGAGISGMQYATSAGLEVTVNPSNSSSVLVNVAREGNKPCPNLSKNNFFFYNYSYTESAWELKNTGITINSVSSTDTYSAYNITILSGLDPTAYMVKVADYRGIMVSASTFSHYTYTFTWNQTLYSSLNRDTIVVEALQNGTLRWLGQNLQLSTMGKPIPPLPVRTLHINRTVDGVNHEVPFQVEDWGSNYRVPLGLTSNASIFNGRNMLAFLVNHEVENVTVTLWWDGRDIATQTSYAWKNIYFSDDPDASSSYGILDNGIVRLRIYNFRVESTVVGGSTTSTAEFMRINGDDPEYGADPAYVIYNGTVRDIIQQEAEWSGGVPNCPNLYSQIVLTFPANSTYYTCALRTIFVSSSESRTITDLSPIQLSSGWMTGTLRCLTENGTSGGFPIVAETYADESNLFYNFSGSPTGWAHHWSEYVKEGKGAGIMFTDNSNMKLYTFDSIPPSQKRGALDVTNDEDWWGRRVTIEFNPVAQFQALFTYPLDVTWHGAVVTFEDEPIYPSSGGNIGLWVMVEHPPIIAVS